MIYVHIPFCKSRCLYCDFFSSTSHSLKQEYLFSLREEISARSEEIKRARANSIYIGGGTPSQLPVEYLQSIFHSIEQVTPIEEGAEVTIECNPDDITEEFLQGLRLTPVNRVSLGVQTMNDELLSLLHRRHKSADVPRVVAMLREAGYHNISLDLMYGLPGQTMQMWQYDVQALLSLNIPHLSAYALQWEEGTPLYAMLERGEVHEADEELSLSMYRYLVEATRQVGMQHYEISNYALPGHRAWHNSGYWRDEPYVGLGPGAHSYDGKNLRSSNPSDLALYIQSKGMPPREEEILSEDELYEEHVLKGLRTSDGLDLSLLRPKYKEYALKMVQPHIAQGRVLCIDNVLKLTEEGFFLSNDIMSDMML